MQKRSRLGEAFVSQNFERFVMSFANVQANGQADLFRNANLATEDVALHVTGRQIVMIIEADFAEAAHLFAHQEFAQLGFRGIVEEPRVVRVTSNCDPSPRHARRVSASTLGNETSNKQRSLHVPRLQVVEDQRCVFGGVGHQPQKLHAGTARSRNS